MSIAMALAIATLVSGGIWLMLDRDLLRVVLGVGLLGHGAVLMLLAVGNVGAPPLVDQPGPFADPLPQALSLTAIVIGFGVMAYLLAISQADGSETATEVATEADATHDADGGASDREVVR